MSLVVSVPVLSVQTTVAAPMVSADDSRRTSAPSDSILFTLKARASVTASGSPSGTATTTTVSAVTTASSAARRVSGSGGGGRAPVETSDATSQSRVAATSAAAAPPTAPTDAANSESLRSRAVCSRRPPWPPSEEEGEGREESEADFFPSPSSLFLLLSTPVTAPRIPPA